MEKLKMWFFVKYTQHRGILHGTVAEQGLRKLRGGGIIYLLN